MFTNVNATKQTEDVRCSFLFVGDQNGQHQEQLGTTTMSGIASSWLWTDSQKSWNSCPPDDLFLTYVQVAIISPTGNSNHSSLSAIILISQAVKILVLVEKFFT